MKLLCNLTIELKDKEEKKTSVSWTLMHKDLSLNKNKSNNFPSCIGKQKTKKMMNETKKTKMNFILFLYNFWDPTLE